MLERVEGLDGLFVVGDLRFCSLVPLRWNGARRLAACRLLRIIFPVREIVVRVDGETSGAQLTPAVTVRYHADMPEIARFLGIVIGIFPREHPPAHFHAVYGEYGITVEIGGGIVHGDFPKRALRLVLEWLDLHRDELLADWELVQSGRPARKIAPLE